MPNKAEEKQVVEYSVVEADIAQMRSVYMDLKITDLEDAEQFKQVKEARLIVKGKRCAVENERKALNANAIAWQKEVNGRAKEIFALIEPIETHLQKEEQKVLDEQNRIKAEEEAKQRAINQKRIDDLLAVECVIPYIDVATMTDEEFNDLLMGKTLEFEERQKAKAEEKAKEDERKKLEEIRLAEERARQAEIAEQQKIQAEALEKQQAELMAKEKAFQEERDRVRREALAKQEAENARIKTEQEAKAKIEQEAKEAEERRIAAENEAKRQEELRPDKEKIVKWLIDITVVANRMPDIMDNRMRDFVSGSKMSIITLLDGLEEKTRVL